MRQRIEQELRQSQKMEAIGQLTGGIAHDFNNLLTVILADIEMLQDRVVDPQHLEILNEARETAEHGAELTERLLAFARRQALNPKLVDVGDLVAQFTGLLRRALGETIEIGPSRPWAASRPTSTRRNCRTPSSTWRSTPATPCRMAAISPSTSPRRSSTTTMPTRGPTCSPAATCSSR